MPETPPSLLEARNVEFRYAEREALRGLSLTLRRGELLGLLGPNGCGKSTFVRLLAGVLRAQSGTLDLLGERVMFGSAQMRLRTGFMFQDSCLDGKLTLERNLNYFAELFRVGGAVRRSRIRELSTLLGLDERLSQRVETLSGGYRRRAELARALIHSPAILILDEPTVGLDAQTCRNVWGYLEELRSTFGLGIIVVTHHMDEAERCDRAVLMHEGRVLAEGTPDGLRRSVAGDVITLDVTDARVAVAEIARVLRVEVRAEGDRVLVWAADGHTLIPKLVDLLGGASVRSITMRRPSLADAFVKLTRIPSITDVSGAAA